MLFPFKNWTQILVSNQESSPFGKGFCKKTNIYLSVYLYTCIHVDRCPTRPILCLTCLISLDLSLRRSGSVPHVTPLFFTERNKVDVKKKFDYIEGTKQRRVMEELINEACRTHNRLGHEIGLRPLVPKKKFSELPPTLIVSSRHEVSLLLFLWMRRL